MRRVLSLFVAVVFCTLSLSPAPARGQGQAPVAPSKLRRVRNPILNQYIVVLNDNVAGSNVPAVASEMRRAHGGSLRFVYTSALKGFSVELPEAAAVRLSRDPRVAFVEENPQGSIIADQVNPPWGLDRIDQRNGRNNVYTYSATGSGVNAYVIDTGIRTTHADFGGRASLAAVFVNEGCNDCNGHGTHVSGTIGGATYGVAKAVSLRGVKVCDAFGSCPGDAVVAGVNWVTSNHVKPAVANMSLGFFGDFVALNNAVRSSISAGVTYAVAAGNDNANANNYSPARVTEALTVAATDINDTRAYFSNFGSVVDLFAPGVDVLSAWNGSDTDAAFLSGTSMASPHVAGVAALYLQNNPAATPAMVNAVIVNNATTNVVFDPMGSPNRLLHSLFGPTQPTNTGQNVPKDYDGDGRADISIKYDDGRWRIDYASNGFGSWDATHQGYGGTDSQAAPADYDGDGLADLSAKFNNGNWGIDYAANGFGAFDVIYPGYGGAESRVTPADYDGDGLADFSCHATNTGQWRIDYASNGLGVWDFNYGGYGYSENREAVADYDGDGRADIAVHSITQGRWNIDYAWNGFGTWNVSVGGFGYSANREAPADYDGDGRADIGIKADDQGRFNIDYAWNGFGTWNASYLGYGFSDTKPAPGDYDGDGRADFAVKTDGGQWLIDYASNGFGAFDQAITLQ
jgi:subtilisin family serine protease